MRVLINSLFNFSKCSYLASFALADLMISLVVSSHRGNSLIKYFNVSLAVFFPILFFKRFKACASSALSRRVITETFLLNSPLAFKVITHFRLSCFSISCTILSTDASSPCFPPAISIIAPTSKVGSLLTITVLLSYLLIDHHSSISIHILSRSSSTG